MDAPLSPHLVSRLGAAGAFETAADSKRSRQIYWDDAAETYDQDFTITLIGQLLRRRIWRELDRIYCQGERILELNCGTGIDARHLAERGIAVLACDISPRMIELARQSQSAQELGDRIDFQVLATECLASLGDQGPFDGAFSNFSGLNCVEDLGQLRRNLARLVRPGAPVLLCMLGRFVPWEIAWFLVHRDRGSAMRRLRQNTCHPPQAGLPKVHYPSVHEIAAAFAPDFRLRNWKGLGIFLPPSYMEHWARRFPRIARALDRADGIFANVPVVRSMADFVLLDFRRMESTSADNADHLAGP